MSITVSAHGRLTVCQQRRSGADNAVMTVVGRRRSSSFGCSARWKCSETITRLRWEEIASASCSRCCSCTHEVAPSRPVSAAVVADWEMNEGPGAQTMVDSGPDHLNGAIGSGLTSEVSATGAVAYRWATVRPTDPPIKPSGWCRSPSTRSGRQADALEVYAQGVEVLRDELGLDPAPELQQLPQLILHHDPSLELRSDRSQANADRQLVCPYKGLAYFERGDFEYFYGREQVGVGCCFPDRR